MNAGSIIAALVGLGVGAAGVALATSSTTPTTPAAAPPNPGPFPVTVGHRYVVTITSTVAFTSALTEAEVVQAFPGSVNVDSTQAAPAGSTMNVISAGATSSTVDTYGFDLLVAPTNPPGVFTAAQLAQPVVPNGPSNANLTVTITDQGATPQMGASAGGATGWVKATQIAPGDLVLVALSQTDFGNIAAASNLAVSVTGWQTILSQVLTPLNLLVAPSGSTTPAAVQAWGPGTPAPSGYPTGGAPGDDPNPSTEYQAQFTYNGTATLAVPTIPNVTLLVWTQTPAAAGSGSLSAGGQQGPPNLLQQLAAAGVLGRAAVLQPGGSKKPPPPPPPTGGLQNPNPPSQPGGPPPTPTVHMVPPSSGDTTAQAVALAGASSFWVSLDQGGTFTIVNAIPGGLQPVPSLPFFLFEPTASSGTLNVTWQDPNGNPFTDSIGWQQ